MIFTEGLTSSFNSLIFLKIQVKGNYVDKIL